MRIFLAVVAVTLATAPAFAMKNLQQSFPDSSCDVVWKAAMSVAKTQDYRIVTVDHEDQIISLIAGGIWGGERIMTLSVQAGEEHGCVAVVQSRYSGLIHSDGPDLLARVTIEVMKVKIDPDSRAFRRFKGCMTQTNGYSARQCLQRLQKEIAKESTQTPKLSKPKPSASAQDPGARDWWNVEKPAPQK
jgi:hypothetical protein